MLFNVIQSIIDGFQIDNRKSEVEQGQHFSSVKVPKSAYWLYMVFNSSAMFSMAMLIDAQDDGISPIPIREFMFEQFLVTAIIQELLIVLDAVTHTFIDNIQTCSLCWR